MDVRVKMEKRVLLDQGCFIQGISGKITGPIGSAQPVFIDLSGKL